MKKGPLNICGMLLEDAFLREKVKMMGIGAGSKKRNAAKFRKQKTFPFLFLPMKSGKFSNVWANRSCRYPIWCNARQESVKFV
ncbi:MAG: hypothetical protein PVI94_26670 [Desulfobacterales bacterium]